MRCHHGITQTPEMQVVLDKGLTALSVREMGQVLSHLGLDCFVTNFKKHKVGAVICLCFVFLHAPYSGSHARQITGADIQCIDLEELIDLAPKCTRVERALLLRTICELDTAAQVSLRSRRVCDALLSTR